jgi:hypothetical protein
MNGGEWRSPSRKHLRGPFVRKHLRGPLPPGPPNFRGMGENMDRLKMEKCHKKKGEKCQKKKGKNATKREGPTTK